MKKKIFAFICCLVTIMYVFTGCSLFVENEDRKLNQTVASVGDVVITLEDLVRSYNSNAETLISNYGYTAEEAVEYCLTSLLSRGVVAQVGKEMEADGVINISNNDKNDAMYDLVDYYKSLMDAYADKAKSTLGYDTSSDKTDSDSSSSTYKKEEKFTKAYDYKVQVVTNQDNTKSYKLVIEPIESDSDKELMPQYVNLYNAYVNGEDITDALFNALDVTYVAEYGEDMKAQIYTEITNAYKNAYSSYKNSTTKQIIVSEMSKILKNYVKQVYVTKVGDYYKNILYNNPSASKMLESYFNKYNESKTKYEGSTTSYISKMLEDASSVYYHPTNDCFYVTHVLLKYSDEQSAYLKEQKQKLSTEEYELCEKKELDKILVNKYDTEGNVVLENVTPEQVLSEIQNALAQATTSREMVEIFNSYIYSYNMDSGNKNASQDYVIARAVKEASESRSKMVTTFTDASRTMYEAYLFVQNGGDIADLKATGKTDEEVEELENKEYIGYRKSYDDFLDACTFGGKTIAQHGAVGTVGTISGLVKSEYGYHIIMFSGTTSNIDLTSKNFDASRVKTEDSSKFAPSTWATFVQNNSLIDLAKIKLLQMVKQADPEATITIDDIPNIFLDKEIQLIALDGYTITLHTDKTYFNTCLEEYASSLSANYVNGLYSDYLNKYKGTNKAYYKNVKVYEYLYS